LPALAPAQINDAFIFYTGDNSRQPFLRRNFPKVVVYVYSDDRPFLLFQQDARTASGPK
jgi:hypothetical protein